jgi:hypothetical protein
MNVTRPSVYKKMLWHLFLSVVVLIIIFPTAALTITSGDLQPVTPSIAKGDPVFIRGIATGHPQQGLQIWVIGNNYARVTTTSVAGDNSFTYELKPADTQNLAAGQYFVLIQHPMMNGKFDIMFNAGTGQVINQELDGGMSIFSLTGPGSLQGPDAAAALIHAINDQNIDDTFSTVTFFVDEASVLIDPIGKRTAQEKFSITGTTNLATGNDLLVEVYSSSFKPTTKQQSGEFFGTTGIVKVMPGAGGYHRWSFDIDASILRPDEYIVRVSAIKQDVTGSATFSIVNGDVLTSVTTIPVPPTTSAIRQNRTSVTASVATVKSTPVPFWIIITALACTFLISCRHFLDKL